MRNLHYNMLPGQFPPAPQPPTSLGASPFSQYAYMGRSQPTRQDAAQNLAQRILGQPAQNVTQGVGQLAAGIGLGLANYQKQGQSFPTAPGGAAPSFGTQIANFFTGRANGGLF
jgi:hypothetical protein